MQPHERIEGFQQVIDRFGCWPSFHDGEVHRVVLDRTTLSASGASVPSLELHLRGWTLGSEVTAEGFYQRHDDTVVHFLFEDVFDCALEGFNHQNVLFSLKLSETTDDRGPVLHVELEHCYGLSGTLSARGARILRVVPYVLGRAC